MKRHLLIAWVLCFVLVLGIPACAEGEWRNILLLGNDTRNFPAFERSDVMMIISVNESSGKVKLTSIMRDTSVPFAQGGSGKINGAMAKGGPENAVATVNQNFGMDITEYIVLDFQQMIKAVDLIGGVDIELNDAERIFINEHYEGFGVDTGYETLDTDGMLHLNGWQSLIYSRDRKSSAAGDYDRVRRQRKLLIALLKELQDRPLDEVMDLSDDLLKLLSSNMSNEQLLDLGKFALALDTERISEYRIPVDGAFESGTYSGVWKIKPNLEKNKRLLREFIYGTELKIGSAGDNVRKLQQKLVDMGLLNDAVDGIYGPKTEAAVKLAQEKLGLDASGTVNEELLDMIYTQ